MPPKKRHGAGAAPGSSSTGGAGGGPSTLNRRQPRAGRGGNGDRVTRSSKAKLTNGLEDPAQVEKELNAQLRAMNLYAANTMGDGNCLFRALSDQFYGHPGFHAMLRDGVCNYLSDKPEKFAGFVDVEKPFDEYVRSMRQNGTYGGHLELSAFAQLYQKEIKIMQPGLVYIVSPVDDTEAPSTRAERERRELERKQLQMTLRPEEEAPGPSAREQRRAMRERKASRGAADLAPRAATSAGSAAASSSTAAGTSGSTQPAAAEGPEGARPEAWGPLYIAYHNWEHYSSIRNIDGPHTGLPRIRERGVSAGGGAANAFIEEETEPTEEEALLINSTGNALSLPLARFLIRQNGGWELALQAWQASQFEEGLDVDAIDAEVQAAGDAEVVYTGERRVMPPCVSASSQLEVVNKWRGVRGGSPSSETAFSSNADAASVDASTTATTAVGDDVSSEAAAGVKVQSIAASSLVELQTAPASPLSSSPGAAAAARPKRAASKAPLSDGRDVKRRSRSRSPTATQEEQREAHSSAGTSVASCGTGSSAGLKASDAISRLSVAPSGSAGVDVDAASSSPTTAAAPAPPAPPLRRGPGRPRKDGQLPGSVPPPPGAPPSAKQLRAEAASKRKLRTHAERLRRVEAREKSQQQGKRAGAAAAAKKEEEKEEKAKGMNIVELHI